MANTKFLKEYIRVLTHMEAYEPNFKADDPSLRLSFSQMGGILTTLGFIPLDMSNNHAEYALVQDLWKLLGGSDIELESQEVPAESNAEHKVRGVSKDDLAYVLLVIKGTRMPEREVEAVKDEKAVGIMKQVVLTDNENNLCTFAIRKGGQEKLHKYFISFYANRRSFEGKPKPKEDPEL